MRKEQLFLLAVLVPLAIITLLVANHFSSRKIPYPTTAINLNSIEEQTSITPVSSKNIEVLSPLGGDRIKSGFIVKGNARVFENVVSIRLLDSAGNILAETQTQANAPDAGQFGPFEEVLKFQSDDSSGTLEVYQVSPKDGSEIDKVSIPLQFSQ